MDDDTRSEKEALGRLGVTAEELGRAARGVRVEIPAGLDSAIRAAARERAHRILRRRIVRLPLWIGSVAAAAAVLIAVGLWAGGTRSGPQGHATGVAEHSRAVSGSPAASPEDTGKPVACPRKSQAMDVDGSGSVDIVDAFLMSRRLRKLKEGGRVPADWDFDRDGEVGTGDVEAVAVAAVSLGGGWR